MVGYRCTAKIIVAVLSLWGLGSAAYLDSVLISTYSIGAYHCRPIACTVVEQGATQGWSFATSMKTLVTKYYPTIKTTHYLDQRDDQVTYDCFKNGETNTSDFIFFMGHGSYGSIKTPSGNSIFLDKGKFEGVSGDVRFGGRTKWGVFHSCLTLNPSTSKRIPYYPYSYNYVPVFKGIHAICGFESNGYNIKSDQCKTYGWFWQCTEKYKCLYDLWYAFATNFIKLNQPINCAWSQAVQVVYADNNLGFSTKSIGVLGKICTPYWQQKPGEPFGWRTFCGFSETFRERFDFPTPIQDNNSSSYYGGLLISNYWDMLYPKAYDVMLYEVIYKYGNPTYGTNSLGIPDGSY